MRQLLIKTAEGLWYGDTERVSDVAGSLEQLLVKLVPAAPPEKITACAEILSGLFPPDDHGHVVTGLMDTSDR